MSPYPIPDYSQNLARITSGAVAPPQIGGISSGSGAMGMTMPNASGLAGLAGNQLLPPTMDGAGMGAGMGGGLWNKIGGMEGLGTIAQGIASLGSVLGSMKGLKLAKEQLAFEKQAYNTNLANTTKSYNTTLEDRIRNRVAANRGSEAEVSSYLAKHSM